MAVGATVGGTEVAVAVASAVGEGSAVAEGDGCGVTVALSPEQAAKAVSPANSREIASRRLDKAMFPFSSPAHLPACPGRARRAPGAGNSRCGRKSWHSCM